MFRDATEIQKGHLERETGQTVLETVKPGIYKGLAANEIGKRCVKGIVDNLKAWLSRFSALELIKTSYDIHEEYAYAKFDPFGRIFLSQKYGVRFGDDTEFEKRITKLGANSRFLVEAGLLFGGLSGVPSKEDMDYLANLVDCVVQWSKNLDLFFYTSELFPDFKLEVTEHGDLLFVHDQRLVEQQESIIEKFAVEQKKAHLAIATDAMQSSKMAKRKTFYSRYSPVDNVYQSRFGYKFTDALKFLVGISDLFHEKRPFGVLDNPRKKLLKKLSQKTGFSEEKTEKIFLDFEINQDKLMREGFPKWRFKPTFSILWKPIVSISIEKRQTFSVVGKVTPVGNISMFVTSLESFLNIGEVTERIRHEKAKKFEDDVTELLTSFGFRTKQNVKSPPGQIDVIGIIRNLILVVECKSPTLKIDPRERVQDLQDSQEWERKLQRKVVWLESNKKRIFEEIVGKKTESSSLTVKGVIVTQRPFVDFLNEKFDVVFWHDFPTWLTSNGLSN
jgi:Holliday junction resolvase-like predicted endonuclease